MLRSRLTAALAAAGTVLGGAVAIGFAVSAPATAASTLPSHVSAPYFETYNGDSLAQLAQQSGNTYLTLAFLQTASKGSCTPYWDGDTSMPVDASQYGSDIDTIRAGGGDVIPSFGGYTADNTGTELADSCTDVGQIAAAYEKVITTYDVTRLDLDIEDNSLTNSAGIDRRNAAIKQVQDWAASNGRTVQFAYTLPTTTGGLAGSGLNVLRSAVSHGARIDVVNIMTFDYYDGANHEMATDTKTATTGLQSQLAGLYPDKSAAELWHMIGVIEMPGIDDYGAAETFTTADAPVVEQWAQDKGLAALSFWALQRDNGGCPGTGGSDSCSGIQQDTWYFSHTFAAFNGGGTSPTTPPTTPPATPPAGSGLVDGDFEAGSLAPWTCTGGSGSIVSSPTHGGAGALKLSPTSSDNATCSQSVTLRANASYTLTAYVQGDYAFLGTTGAATDANAWTNAGEYTKLSATFTTGGTGTVQVFVHGWYGQGAVYVDDVSVS
ncbi:carbohydrate binding domain-containing protein [Actinocatenispora sera]|uniref:carbohydrate binding domain-containing protein n=1 Tax=Actinocatenispora sera TaxID=390989 RepID=UPI0033EF1FA0